MRLRKLTLQKYGSIAEQTLRFADGPGLSIIYGPNEAGKSTSLAALTDFLFGIPNISAHTAHFGPEGMRIGATLEAADGKQIELERRRGRGKARTLLDAEGSLQPEQVLQAMLGTTTRERFNILFGLNHDTLRTGGDALLAADGEIGRLIVEAGGGLSTLMTRMGELDEEAATYYAPHAAKNRAFYQARQAFNDAQANIDRLELSYHGFRKAQEKQELAQATLAAHKKTRERRTKAVQEAERLMKVVPELIRLDDLQARLDQDKAAASFGAHFDAHVDEALRNKAQAQQWFDEAQSQATAAQATMEALPLVPTALLEAEADIRDVLHHARAVQASEPEMHRLRQSVSDRAEALQALGERLGFGGEALSQTQMPEAQTLEELRRLIEAQKSQAPLLREREAQREALERQLQDLHARIDDAKALGLFTAVDVEAEVLRPIAAVEAELEVRRSQQRLARAAIEQAAADLGLSGVAALRALVCPEREQIDAAVDEATQAKQARLQHAQAQLEHKASLTQLQAELSTLTTEGLLVSRQEVQSARAARNILLEPIADSFVSAKSQETQGERHTSVLKLRASIRQADELVDKQNQEAKRALEVGMCRARIDAAQAGIAQADAQMRLVDTHLEAHLQHWRGAFAQATALQPALEGLQRFVHVRDELLVRDDAVTNDAAQLAADTAQFELLMTQLRLAEMQLKLHPHPETSLVDRRNMVFRAMQAHADGRRDALREQADAARLSAERDAATVQLARMREQDAQTRTAWSAILSKAGLQSGTTLGHAADWAALWVQAREARIASQADRAHLEQLRAAGARLQQTTRALADRLSLTASAHPVATAELLRTRLDEAKQLGERHQTAQVALAQALKQQDQRRQALAQTDKAIVAVAKRAGVSPGDSAALRQAATRFADYQARLADHTRGLRVVTTLADGQRIDALRAAWDGRDAQALAADTKAAQAQRQHIEHDIEVAWGAHKEANDHVQAFEGDNGVNLAHAQRAQATAQLHAAAERYIELSVAKELIATAMNKLRSARKSPLVQRASQLFAATTQGRYAGVATDVDLKGAPIVVGQKPDGSTVKVATMSDGTRDQLFLAFRLASLEEYAQQAEALPFVADDILVHFDDSRGAATLKVLADFAQKTQVLLFTHHTSVVEASQSLVEAGLAQVVRLGAG